jgi:Domain of unknown function (DUF6457)
MSELDQSVRAWCDDYAAALGVDTVTDAEIESLLSVAGVAAHASARQSAPITCWLAAKAGVTVDAALAIAQRLADEPSI